MGDGRRGDFETKYIDEKFSEKQRIIETQGLNKRRWNNVGLASFDPFSLVIGCTNDQ